MTKQPPEGLAGGLTNYGDPAFSAYLRRSFARSMGFSRELLSKPIIGITATASGFNNCHRGVPELIEAVKRGVLAAGGLPLEFPVISLGEVFLNPTSMMFRNLMAMCVEEMIRAQPMDAVVLVGGCDKTLPALVMGAASAGKPAILLATGPMLTSRYRGERLGACTDCRRFWARYRAGEIDDANLERIERGLATTAGTCSVMGTASTMAILCEALGLMLPGTAAIPAVHADRLRAAEATGTAAMELARSGRTLNDVVSAASLRNALRVLLASGGSTNGIIHLTAMARRFGLRLGLHDLDDLSDSTPVLVDLKPTGQGYMEDFFAAGGVGALLRRLSSLIDLDARTVTGDSLRDTLPDAENWIDGAVIRGLDQPVSRKGGIVALFGSLAPNGAILKRAAADETLFERSFRAVVFEDLADLAARIDAPDLDVRAGDALILRRAGPRACGMPEAGYIPIPRKLAERGVKDMLRISDARMSGTAYGTIVLHSPEADADGPIGLVRSGDTIKMSVAERRLDLMVDAAELDRRRAERPPTEASAPRGWRKLYHDRVLQAEDGCDLDFLTVG
ncbi:MAG: dihydroxy-acid dehydratase [Hyphomicrobiales bacterium]